MLSALTVPASAQNLTARGPLSPVTNFPLWFQDQTGRSLELCTAHSTDNQFCLFDPVIPGDAYSEQIGFGAEAFWWIGETSVDMPASAACPDCQQGLIVLAVEAAFNAEVPVQGDEFTFGRVRIRIDAPFAGTYVVTHPFGTNTFQVATPGGRAINESNDIGGANPDFDGPLRSGIQSFLVWDPIEEAPAGFVGDPAIPHRVQGLPGAFTGFRIEYLGGDGPLAGEPFTVETDLFTVAGKIFTGDVPAPLTVSRATFSEGRAEVMAISAPDALVSVRFDDHAEVYPLTGDGLGNFFLSVAQAEIPAVAHVTSAAGNNTPTTQNIPVTDVVTIERAEYDMAAQELRIGATSSVAPAPVLTYRGQPLDPTTGLVVPNVAVPPARVVVTSALNGTDDEPVLITGTVNQPDPLAPVANDDTATTPFQTAVTIAVAANDTDGDGNVEPGSVQIVQGPQNGTLGVPSAAGVQYTPAAGFSGTDSFTYTIADNDGLVSNVATVTVTVEEEQQAPAETFSNLIARNISTTWTVSGVTSDATNNVITIWNGAVGSTVLGQATVSSTGSFSYRTTTGPARATTFVTLVSSNGTTVQVPLN